MTRALAHWLDAFEEYTEPMASPLQFRRWGGLSIIAAAMERKTWIENAIGVLYPNLYVFLMGPPAVGKTIVTNTVWQFMRKLSEHKLASRSVTRATVIQELAEASRYQQNPGKDTLVFNALYVISNELGVLLPAWELEIMNKLTDLYEGHPYSESRRNKQHSSDIKKPIINILAAGTPGYLGEILPDVAWNQGFMSRVNIIYSGEQIRRSLFTMNTQNTDLYDKLVADLRKIARMVGEYTFTPAAQAMAEHFHMEGHRDTAPMHPKLEYYCQRRPAHLLKLMMVISAAESDDLMITEAHAIQALQYLTEAEVQIPNIFKAMSSGGDSQIMKELWYHVYEITLKTKKGVSEDRLYEFLSQRIPVEKIKWILDVMKNSKLLRVEVAGPIPLYFANGTPAHK